MLDLNTATHYWMFPKPADMRKGKAKLAILMRERIDTDLIIGSNTFIFYFRDMKTVKILHHDFAGYELYIKWFDDGRFLKPVFSTRERHTVTRS